MLRIILFLCFLLLSFSVSAKTLSVRSSNAPGMCSQSLDSKIEQSMQSFMYGSFPYIITGSNCNTSDWNENENLLLTVEAGSHIGFDDLSSSTDGIVYNKVYSDDQCSQQYSGTSTALSSDYGETASFGACSLTVSESEKLSLCSSYDGSGNQAPDGYQYCTASWDASSSGEVVLQTADGVSSELVTDQPEYMVEDASCSNNCVTVNGKTFTVDQSSIPLNDTLKLTNPDGTAIEYTADTVTHYDETGAVYDPNDTGSSDGGSDGSDGGSTGGTDTGGGTDGGSTGGGSTGGTSGGTGDSGTGDGEEEGSGSGGWSGAGEGYNGFGGEEEHAQKLVDAKAAFGDAIETIKGEISGRFSSVSASGSCSGTQATVWHNTTVDLSACGYLDQMLPVIRPAVLFGCSAIAAFILFGRRNG